MNYYFSRTGTIVNLAAAKEAGFGILVSRAGEWRTEGFDDWIADNGAWSDFQAGRDFDEDAFELFLIWVADQPVKPRFLVLPDIVAGGMASLALSSRYLNRGLDITPLVLIAVQDGMTTADLAPLVGPSVGVFLGGSTEWKLAEMKRWGVFCRALGIHYHVARVNTLIRFGMAAGSFATSADGSSASKFVKSIPRLKRGVDIAKKYAAMISR